MLSRLRTTSLIKSSLRCFETTEQRCDNIHDSGIERLRVLITWNAVTRILPVLENFENLQHVWWPHSHPQIWVLMSMHRMCSKFSGTDKIRVFTSMHQMYSTFSKLSGIGMSVPNFGYYDTSPKISLRFWKLSHRYFYCKYNRSIIFECCD